MFAGCARTGARFTACTVIVKLFVSFVAKDVAVTDAANVPEVPATGARWMFPVRVVPDWTLSVLAMNVGSAVDPTVTVMLAGAARDAGRSTLFAVTVSDFESVPPAPSLTLIDTVAVPESLNPGANARFPVPVPVPGVVVVTVA